MCKLEHSKLNQVITFDNNKHVKSLTNHQQQQQFHCCYEIFILDARITRRKINAICIVISSSLLLAIDILNMKLDVIVELSLVVVVVHDRNNFILLHTTFVCRKIVALPSNFVVIMVGNCYFEQEIRHDSSLIISRSSSS